MSEFVAIRTYGDYISAHLDKQLLDAAGILNYLKDEHTLTIDPLLIPAIGGMRLMVPEEALAKAWEILNAPEDPEALEAATKD
jgi:hypothetical protein